MVDRVGPDNPSQIQVMTSGGSYETAREICVRSGCHIITDFHSRWKMIEMDRAAGKVDDSGWEPFAKSIQQSQLQSLSSTSLPLARRLRMEGRLEGMRGFLRRTWNTSSSAPDFSTRRTEDFTVELSEQVQVAKAEWDKIGQDMVKFALGETVIAGAISAIQSSNWAWYAVGLGAALGGTAVHSAMRENSVRRQFPAALFIGA